VTLFKVIKLSLRLVPLVAVVVLATELFPFKCIVEFIVTSVKFCLAANKSIMSLLLFDAVTVLTFIGVAVAFNLSNAVVITMFDVFVPIVEFSTFGSTEDTVVKLAVVPLRIGKSVLEVTLLNEVALIANSAVVIFDVNFKVVFKKLVVTFSTFCNTEDSVVKLAVVPLSIGKAVLEVTLLTKIALVVVRFDVNFEVVGSELVVVVILDNELAAVA
jgi:hypothetical protein